jgi:hypothetical protein
VAQQSTQVDNISGATMTSLGIKSAVEDALTTAGADLDSFRVKTGKAEKTKADDEEYDIVVVGGGMSGMSAAIEVARNSDASVLVLEKEAYAGGSSLVCGGGIWAINSEVNKEIDQDSTVDEYIDFMKMRSQTDDLNTGLMTNIYNKVDDVITYYMEHDLPVVTDTWTLGHPDSQLPVLWSANNSKYDWETGESGVFQAVEKMAKDLGVEVRVNSKVTELVHDDTSVSGVMVEDLEHTYQINAKKVILATGGFTRNADLVDKYAPDYKDAFAFTGAGCTGDGLALTEDFDINIVGEGMMGLFGVNMNYGYYGSIGNLVWLPQMYVNAEGKQFGMETAFYSDTLKMLLEQTGSCAYAIFDSSSSVIDRLDGAVEEGCAKRYDSIEELAADQEIDAAALAETAQENSLADSPYYCVVVRPLFIGSIPGLEVDDTCHVVTSDGNPVENLYACGELIFGNVFQTAYPASGTGVGTSTYTGAIAGEAAYKELVN